MLLVAAVERAQLHFSDNVVPLESTAASTTCSADVYQPRRHPTLGMYCAVDPDAGWQRGGACIRQRKTARR